MLLIIALLAFATGRLSHLASASDPASDIAPEPPQSQAGLTCTSTAGLCPCPAPPPTVQRRRLGKRPVATVKTAVPPAPDATASTAAYLREHARDFAVCAPGAGEALRVHLELTVTPDGEIKSHRIANLTPVPRGTAECIKQVASQLDPPGFDASLDETFALTLVL